MAQLGLALISGIAWTIVYFDSIRIGIRQKTYAMPFWALALNISWELLYSILGLQDKSISVQTGINIIWFILDLGLLTTYIIYGKKHFPTTFKPIGFTIWTITGLVISFMLQYVFFIEFGKSGGASYSAYLQNLLMSILFIGMLAQRGSSEGQTLLIAISKWVGTLAPTLSITFFGGPVPVGDPLILWAGVAIAILDIAYIILLRKMKNGELSKQPA